MIRHYKKALQTKQAWRAFSLSGSRVALRVECDPGYPHPPRPCPGFNPRTPCGVRQAREHMESVFTQFQSTHSVWSATKGLLCGFPHVIVSIHALRVECDRSPSKRNGLSRSFNPRTPCGVRPGHPALETRPRCFNPRTPCGVRLQVWQAFINWRTRCFNPRTPCGVRPACGPLAYGSKKFQSTHSVWSATSCPSSSERTLTVSIHALRVECDLPTVNSVTMVLRFNPRTPCGVRLRMIICTVIQQCKRYFAPTSRRRPSLHGLLSG